jgi:lactate dehydrogenase-like 2-hydroxyacid dehydrogenase
VINGNPAEGTVYMFDGILSHRDDAGDLFFFPPVDAIQEFKVQTSSAPASYGGNPTMINVTFRSGTNQFHGAFYEFVRNSGLDVQWPNRIGSGKLANPSVGEWFNTADFVSPGNYAFGNSGRNILFGPGTQQFDVSLFKDIAFSSDGSRRLPLRAESFNVFNSSTTQAPRSGPPLRAPSARRVHPCYSSGHPGKYSWRPSSTGNREVLLETEIPIYRDTMQPAPCPRPGERKAYLARVFTPLIEAKISERYQVRRNPSGGAMKAEELASNAQGCDYLFVSATEQVPRMVFERLAGPLKAVATLSVGFNHVDIEAARAHGVAVFHSPGVLTDACAEIAMLLILNAARRGHEGDVMVRSGRWPGWAPTQLLGLGLAGRRLGILGMGRIGQAVADRARSFGVQIHYHNRKQLPPELEKSAVFHDKPESLLEVSDIFLITAPGSPELAGFLNRPRIALLPANAIVVNVARGEMVDDDALIEALRDKKVFAAGLDVFYREPDVDPRYFTLDNVFLTPHLGSSTEDTRDAMGLILLEGLHALETGQVARNRVC